MGKNWNEVLDNQGYNWKEVITFIMEDASGPAIKLMQAEGILPELEFSDSLEFEEFLMEQLKKSLSRIKLHD